MQRSLQYAFNFRYFRRPNPRFLISDSKHTILIRLLAVLGEVEGIRNRSGANTRVSGGTGLVDWLLGRTFDICRIGLGLSAGRLRGFARIESVPGLLTRHISDYNV
jgi:hypothetical protein